MGKLRETGRPGSHLVSQEQNKDWEEIKRNKQKNTQKTNILKEHN